MIVVIVTKCVMNTYYNSNNYNSNKVCYKDKDDTVLAYHFIVGGALTAVH